MARGIGIGGILALAILLAACGAGTPNDRESPFAFRDIERMALVPAPTQADRSDIAFAYQAKLRTFEAIYGEGVGPAKRAPAFRACREAFDEVARFADSPDAESESATVGLSLLQCRQSAEGWRSGEMATFGNDVRLMSSGSLVVLGYALRHADGDDNAAVLDEGLRLLREDRGGD